MGDVEEQATQPATDDPWRLSDQVRLRRIREDAKRPLEVNLAEGLALSEFLSTFTGACLR